MDCRAQLPHSRLAETFSADFGRGGAPCMTTQPNAIGCSPFAVSGRSLFPVGRMAREDMVWAWSRNPTILPHSIPLGSGLLFRTTAPEEDYAMIWVDAWIKSCYGPGRTLTGRKAIIDHIRTPSHKVEYLTTLLIKYILSSLDLPYAGTDRPHKFPSLPSYDLCLAAVLRLERQGRTPHYLILPTSDECITSHKAATIFPLFPVPFRCTSGQSFPSSPLLLPFGHLPFRYTIKFPLQRHLFPALY